MQKRNSQDAEAPDHVPCVFRQVQDDLIVEVRQFAQGCNHPSYLIQVLPRDGLDKLFSVAFFGDESLETVIRLLTAADTFIKGERTRPFGLPIVEE
jgi:hypothetical protein